MMGHARAKAQRTCPCGGDAWSTCAATSDACTVFVMTDGRQVLFCNNEDFSNPNTRIWFLPGAEGRHGCVYVGFDDGWGQGGCNTQGLAFGWVAGFKERWERPAGLQTVKGNPCQRMLETCATVEEADAFFERYWEESFSYGKLLIADSSGKSVLLGDGWPFGGLGREAFPRNRASFRLAGQ